MKGYYLSTNGCYFNNICNIANCLSCSDSNYCSECETGYSLNTGSCYLDPINNNSNGGGGSSTLALSVGAIIAITVSVPCGW